MMDKKDEAIRIKYEKLGVEKYYKKYAFKYTNPHFLQIEELLINNEKHIDYSKVLDFCAGGGEASKVLQELGYKGMMGSDPFTHKLYKRNVKRPCEKWSFEEVIRQKMTGDYSSIICSFGMHLCEEKKLYPLTLELFQHAPTLVIITPHKRPILEEITGIEKVHEDFALTPKGKKVRLKVYGNVFIKEGK